MKKLLMIMSLLLILMALAACGGNENNTADLQGSPTEPPIQNELHPTEPPTEPPIEPPAQNEPAATEPPLPAPEPYDTYELCPECGMHYAHEPLRQPTPPMNIHEIHVRGQGWDTEFPQAEHEANIAGFVRDFENVHTVTYLQFETNRYSTLVLWADEPLRDFSFVSLDTSGHSWEDDGMLIINTREELLSIDYLPTTDAVILNVAFHHYLLPHGAIIFTDEQGNRRRLFIQEDMRGGCFPAYHLQPDDNFAELNG